MGLRNLGISGLRKEGGVVGWYCVVVKGRAGKLGRGFIRLFFPPPFPGDFLFLMIECITAAGWRDIITTLSVR